MTYTTKQLVHFLEQELRATWQGKRISLTAEEKIDNPVIAKAIDVEKVGRVFSYRDFRSQIHQYQLEHQVSGIVWREVKFKDKSFLFPELYNQLVEVEGDKQYLLNAKESVLDFWREITEDMKFYLTEDRVNPITNEHLESLYREAQWAEIDIGIDEIYLGLCWGNPKDYIHKWAKPDSGYYRIIATKTQPSSINI